MKAVELLLSEEKKVQESSVFVSFPPEPPLDSRDFNSLDVDTLSVSISSPWDFGQ